MNDIIQNPDLKKLPSSKGIWAPCLTYCETEDLFYVVYGVMNSMNARYFDVDNFLVTAKDMKGPWSEPVYLHSTGFDASLFHDDDGKKYIVALEWETRTEYEKPGQINIMEYNPGVKQQKAGHASYVDLPNGETWLAYHVSRPFVPELRCTLGRETAIQQMEWTEDGWLHTKSGNRTPEEYVQPSALTEVPVKMLPGHDDFDLDKLNIGYYAPRINPESFIDLVSRPGWARLRGQESGCSLNKASIHGRDVQFSWSFDGKNYAGIGPVFDISKLSDEYSEYGEFTGTFAGITCSDMIMHKHTADFDFFDYQAEENTDVK